MAYKVIKAENDARVGYKVVVPEKYTGDKVAEAVVHLSREMAEMQKDTSLQIRALSDAIQTVSKSFQCKESEYSFDVIRGKDGKISAIHARPV